MKKKPTATSVGDLAKRLLRQLRAGTLPFPENTKAIEDLGLVFGREHVALFRSIAEKVKKFQKGETVALPARLHSNGLVVVIAAERCDVLIVSAERGNQRMVLELRERHEVLVPREILISPWRRPQEETDEHDAIPLDQFVAGVIKWAERYRVEVREDNTLCGRLEVLYER